jgi:hypothetical protein
LHNPTDADYILTAVLLASHLCGSAAAIQELLCAFKDVVPHTQSAQRVQLAAAFKLREGPQMDRVVTVAERLLGVELGERAVLTYCVQISSGKYQKKGQKKTTNRMLSGDHAHFSRICHHVAQIGNEHLGHLAGKGGRYGKVAEKPAVDSDTMLMEVQEELKRCKQMLRAETATSQRYHGRISDLKSQLKARDEPDPSTSHHAAQLREAHRLADELQGRLQGAERKLERKGQECGAWKAKAHAFDAEVKEAHDANAGLRDDAGEFAHAVGRLMTPQSGKQMPNNLAKLSMELTIAGVASAQQGAVTSAVLAAAHPELRGGSFGPKKTAALKSRTAVGVISTVANCFRLAQSKTLPAAASDDTEADQRAVSAVVCWDEKHDLIVPVPPVMAAGGKADDVVEVIETYVFDYGQAMLNTFFTFCCADEALVTACGGIAGLRKLFPDNFETAVTPAKVKAFMGDNCNTQLKVGRLVKEMCKRSWVRAGHDEAEFVFFFLRCFQHIKNTWAKSGAGAEARFLKAELQNEIDALPPASRVTCQLKNLYITIWKAVGSRGEYANGYGRKSWPVYLLEYFPKAMVLTLMRPLGQRFDGEVECSLMLYANAEPIIGFCVHHGVKINLKREAKTMLDCIMILLSCAWILAALRARCIIFLKLFWPMRFIVAGDSGVSNADMNTYIRCVERAVEQLAQDGTFFLDADLDIFSDAGNATVTAFHARRRLAVCKSADGSVLHNVFEKLESDLYAPDPDDKRASATDDKTAAILQVWGAALRQSLSDSQSQHWLDGGMYGNNPEAEKVKEKMRATIDTGGKKCTLVNDECESLLGLIKQLMKRAPDLSVENAAAVAAAMKTNVFGAGGWLATVDERLADKAVEFAWASVARAKSEQRERRAAIEKRKSAEAAAALDAVFNAQVTAEAKAKTYFEMKRLGEAAVRAGSHERESNKQGQKMFLRDQMLIYHYYGVQGAKVPYTTMGNDELLKHVCGLARRFKPEQKPETLPGVILARAVPCLGECNELRAAAEAKPLFGAAELGAAVGAAQATAEAAAAAAPVSGGDPYAHLQPEVPPSLPIGTAIERLQHVQPDDGASFNNWVPWTVIGMQKWGAGERYVLARGDENVVVSLGAEKFNDRKVGSWRLDLDANVIMCNFAPQEMAKFVRSGLEVKPGTQRGAPMQEGALLLLKQDGGQPQFLTQVLKMEDRGAEYKPKKYRYNHVFAFLVPIEDVEFKFNAKHDYTVGMEDTITIFMPLSKDWSTSTGHSGFCPVPLEGISKCEGGQDVVDRLLAKMLVAVASKKDA